MLRLRLHDDDPAKPGEKHGVDGPTHAGTTYVDYEYQIEQWVIDLEQDAPHIVRCRCPELRREWTRGEGRKFREVPYDDAPPVHVGIVQPEKHPICDGERILGESPFRRSEATALEELANRMERQRQAATQSETGDAEPGKDGEAGKNGFVVIEWDS